MDLEFSRNATTFASLEDGKVVVTWRQDGTRLVFAQVFDANGTELGEEFMVSDTSQNYDLIRVEMLPDGNLVFVWTEQSGDPNYMDIKQRIVGQDGVPVTDVATVNTLTDFYQTTPAVTVLDNGGYVIAYSSNQGVTDVHDGSSGAARATIFDANGNPVGDEFIVNTTTEGHQGIFSVAALEGGFVAVYSSPDPDGDSPGIRGKIFANDGSVLVEEFVVADTAGYEDFAEINVLANGGFAISWSVMDVDTGESDLKVMIYNSAGVALTSEPITSPVEGDVFSADIVALPDGRSLLAYAQYSADYSVSQIYGQYINADGTLDGDRFTLVARLEGTIDYPQLELQGDRLLIAFNDSDAASTRLMSFDLADIGPLPNEAPTDITLSSTTVSESWRTGTSVGTLGATDAEGDTLTYTLVANEGHNSNFGIRTNTDGTFSLYLKGPLDHENAQAPGGVYNVVIDVSDGTNTTRQSFEITSLDDPFKLSSAPTGKNYTSVMENAEKGQEIGYIMQFDTSFVPVSATLVDDADGKFDIKSRTVNGADQYYLTVKGALDHETSSLETVTIRATDANGVTKDKTFEIQVLDAPEKGDASRGLITIDAATTMAGAKGGINWDTYLDAQFAKITPGLPAFLPNGSGWNPSTPANQFVYSNTTDNSIVSIKGSNLVYNWVDPISGEDAHVVSGTINELAFGKGTYNTFTEAELTISGLDLSNDSGLMNRIEGDAQIVAQAWMYGPDGTSPADIAFVKATLAAHAQHFIGSKGNDTYTGTMFDDVVEGGAGKDMLKGGGGADTITGGTGKDTIDGGAGDDIVNGGKGVDTLKGGSGADTFVFVKGDTGKTRAAADVILDFKPGQGDTIDLSGWDANSRKAGDQDFKFIGSDSFNGKAGELRFVKEKSDTWIMGDTNGDKKADFIIHLDDAMKLKVDHFDL
ncbi:hypothetical protein [Rhizobium sp.]